MLFAPRVPTKQLAEFLRRLSMSLEVGIDIRKALTSEAARCTGRLRAHTLEMSDAINGGASLSAAINDTGEFFPSLVRQLVAVGEQTGNLPEVLKQLSEHYDEQLKLRRIFTSTIAWPMIQLGMALAIVGFLIWVAGVLPRIDAKHPNDLLGFGLTGEIGLLIYLLILGAFAGGWFRHLPRHRHWKGMGRAAATLDHTPAGGGHGGANLGAGTLRLDIAINDGHGIGCETRALAFTIQHAQRDVHVERSGSTRSNSKRRIDSRRAHQNRHIPCRIFARCASGGRKRPAIGNNDDYRPATARCRTACDGGPHEKLPVTACGSWWQDSSSR